MKVLATSWLYGVDMATVCAERQPTMYADDLLFADQSLDSLPPAGRRLVVMLSSVAPTVGKGWLASVLVGLAESTMEAYTEPHPVLPALRSIRDVVDGRASYEACRREIEREFDRVTREWASDDPGIATTWAAWAALEAETLDVLGACRIALDAIEGWQEVQDGDREQAALELQADVTRSLMGWRERSAARPLEAVKGGAE